MKTISQPSEGIHKCKQRLEHKETTLTGDKYAYYETYTFVKDVLLRKWFSTTENGFPQNASICVTYKRHNIIPSNFKLNAAAVIKNTAVSWILVDHHKLKDLFIPDGRRLVLPPSKLPIVLEGINSTIEHIGAVIYFVSVTLDKFIVIVIDTKCSLLHIAEKSRITAS